MMDLFGMGLSFAGAGALGYVAAGSTNTNDELTMRLSLTKDGAFLTDARLIGGLAALAGATFIKGMSPNAKKALSGIALVSGISLATTEGIRMKLQKKPGTIAQGFTAMPSWKKSDDQMGAYGASSKAYQSSWAA